jgi:hypothetical protein
LAPETQNIENNPMQSRNGPGLERPGSSCHWHERSVVAARPDLVLRQPERGDGLAICGVSASGGRSHGGTRRGLPAASAQVRSRRSSAAGEPTNHLDLAAIEKLENVLKGFDGALIVVSHDEAILRTIGSSRKIALVWAMYL